MKKLVSHSVLVIVVMLGLAVDSRAREIEIEAGRTKTIGTRKQVIDTRVSVGDRNIVAARFVDGRLELRAVQPGTSRVTFSGYIVRYNSGIPAVNTNLHRRIPRSIPTQQNVPFEESV